MTKKERVYWKQINEEYTTAESSDEENGHIKCHHIPWASDRNKFIVYGRDFVVDLPLCHTINKIGLTFMITFTLHQTYIAQSFRPLP